MERKNIRLIGGPYDGRVIALIVDDRPKPRLQDAGICVTEVVYEPSGFYEPLTGYEHFRWKETNHLNSNDAGQAEPAAGGR